MNLNRNPNRERNEVINNGLSHPSFHEMAHMFDLKHIVWHLNSTFCISFTFLQFLFVCQQGCYECRRILKPCPSENVG